MPEYQCLEDGCHRAVIYVTKQLDVTLRRLVQDYQEKLEEKRAAEVSLRDLEAAANRNTRHRPTPARPGRGVSQRTETVPAATTPTTQRTLTATSVTMYAYTEVSRVRCGYSKVLVIVR